MAYKEFTVDAALLQELGERLIGRPDIAIAELIKNAYDADASTCEIQIGGDRIVVADNGEGMDQAAFEKHYLRLGTQHKRKKGVSTRLGRPLTGAKGVGRLASQFLGRRIRIESYTECNCGEAVVVNIDWSKLAGGSELNSFKVDVQSVRRSQIGDFPEGTAHGTRITIKRLKVDLDRSDIKSLGREVWSLRAPFNRFGSGRSRMRREDPDNFDIRFQSGENEFVESFDAILDDLVDRLWRARITGRIAWGRETDLGEVEVDFTERYPASAPVETFADGVKLSDLRPVGARAEKAPKFGRPLIHEVEFTIYVYKLENRQKARVPLAKLKDYLSRFGNVSIYDAGFRLPYYGIDTDWLQNGADFSRRLAVSALLPSKWGIDGSNLIHLPEPRRLFGIVNINTGREARAALNCRAPSQRQDELDSWLEIQPGRDRLHDNDAYSQLQAFVRYALDLYANRFRARSLRVAEKFPDREPADRKYRRLLQLLEENRDAMPAAVYEKVWSEAKSAEAAAKGQEFQFAERISAIAPLAAAGMSALAMTHELNRETRSLESARQLLCQIADEQDLPKLVRTANELDQSLKRIRSLQSLFSPLLSEEDREGRRRLRVEPIVDQVVEGMKPLTPGMNFEINIDEKMRFPDAPITAWNAILQNVIANAWNACLASKTAKVRIDGFEVGRGGVLWISDTGVGIDLDGADRMFDAFERKLQLSPAHRPIALGGTGMGLAIVRMLAERHRAKVAFVESEAGFATTFQLAWRK